jgi:hypothetical protein
VNEHICCAAVGSDKAEALLAVKPFHSSLWHIFQLLSYRTDVPKTSWFTVARAARINRTHRGRVAAAWYAVGRAARRPGVECRFRRREPASKTQLCVCAPERHAGCSVNSEPFRRQQ